MHGRMSVLFSSEAKFFIVFLAIRHRRTPPNPLYTRPGWQQLKSETHTRRSFAGAVQAAGTHALALRRGRRRHRGQWGSRAFDHPGWGPLQAPGQRRSGFEPQHDAHLAAEAAEAGDVISGGGRQLAAADLLPSRPQTTTSPPSLDGHGHLSPPRCSGTQGGFRPQVKQQVRHERPQGRQGICCAARRRRSPPHPAPVATRIVSPPQPTHLSSLPPPAVSS